jgi:succinate dehydrogenase/fumarate reductase flavoprotein subunit
MEVLEYDMVVVGSGLAGPGAAGTTSLCWGGCG